ncbi:MAG: hypothetical protein K6E30_02735 [Lachnospiraceae bacterium]|nr:hypothetical protein [Lachnospiraceae bacterium]
MKYARILLLLLLGLSAAAFGASKAKEFTEKNANLPVFTCSSDVLELSCDYTDEDLLYGITAYDKEDGDLTDKILVGSFSRFIADASCSVTYVVFDSANAASTYERKVRFNDYVSPRILLSEPLVFTEGSGSTDLVRSRLVINDKLDGSLAQSAQFSNISVYYDYEGDYSLTVTATNSFGDIVEETLPVHIIPKTYSSLTISLSAPKIYLAKGEAFDPMDYVKDVADLSGNSYDPKSHVAAKSDVNTDAPGTYEVFYEAENGGGEKGETWLIVTVEE